MVAVDDAVDDERACCRFFRRRRWPAKSGRAKLMDCTKWDWRAAAVIAVPGAATARRSEDDTSSSVGCTMRER